MTDRNYQHSRPLDVHRWSEYAEVNVFIDEVYDDYLNTQSKENVRIKKKHLKVILLDLYVAWLNDPELNIAVHMTEEAYSNGTVFNKGKSRYNELHLKGSIRNIIHRLQDAGLIGRKKGYEGAEGLQGYLTQKPTETLIEMLRRQHLVCFKLVMLKAENYRSRDEDKNDVEYEERYIKDMRQLVTI